MPCLNEAETLETCIKKARTYLDRSGVCGEIVVADNSSTDGSQAIAVRNGARVIDVAEKGYGNALIAGINAARGSYVIMGDADDSYDFLHLDGFMEKLRQGYDLVMGNRFKGGIRKGAMPPLHRYLGNPVLTAIGRLFFKCPAGDFHCGLRGFSRAAILKLDLQCSGMEFASEMVIKATIQGLSIVEVPTTLDKDGRSRPPHLRSWRDGWRHLRFMLLHSPRWLFLYPGLFLTLFGACIVIWLLPGDKSIGRVSFGIHTLLYAATIVLIGMQIVSLAVFTRVYGIKARLLKPNALLNKLLDLFSLETCIVIGGLLMAFSIGLFCAQILFWGQQHFGNLNAGQVMRWAIPSTLLFNAGIQILIARFFLSILELKTR